uniref:Uncharacterized protein n=1 Tax=Candidatus Berkiella aquae TaxID=295108 RepID=A0A0Q9YXW0_9GAMM
MSKFQKWVTLWPIFFAISLSRVPIIWSFSSELAFFGIGLVQLRPDQKMHNFAIFHLYQVLGNRLFPLRK